MRQEMLLRNLKRADISKDVFLNSFLAVDMCWVIVTFKACLTLYRRGDVLCMQFTICSFVIVQFIRPIVHRFK